LPVAALWERGVDSVDAGAGGWVLVRDGADREVRDCHCADLEVGGAVAVLEAWGAEWRCAERLVRAGQRSLVRWRTRAWAGGTGRSIVGGDSQGFADGCFA